MFCSKCGAENPEGIQFCSRCGTGLGAAAKPSGITPAMVPMLLVFIAAAIGLLLGIIGWQKNQWELYSAGTFIVPLALIWGGLFLEGQKLPLRVTLLAIGGGIILLFMR